MTSNPYVRLSMPGHPLAMGGRLVYAHRLAAYNALSYIGQVRMVEGIGVTIHHIDGDRKNNAGSNLVILENTTEHKALHYRLAVLRAGGNPWTQRLCRSCGGVKSPSEFYVRKDYGDERPRSTCVQCYQSKYGWTYPVTGRL